MKTKILRPLYLVAALALVTAACGDDDAASTTAAPTTTEAVTTTAPMDDVLRIEASTAAITVDGDASDWAGVTGLDLALEPIESETVAPKDATIKVAYDTEFLYVLFTVGDDFNWNAEDPHLSASSAVMFAIEAAAGPHMGTDEEGEEESYTSLGMVDIWHWELECAIGADQGGATGAGPGDGDLGNDSGCNFDDEWSTDPETREDDNGAGAENSLLGVFGHSNPVDDGEGTWIFEMRRPLQTGDAGDAQFAVGETGLMALAYWDADNSPEGWDDPEHVQSSHLGWIEVTLIAA
ncbi:MAG: ethylbenzene dehydrogenase-related protein [Actinomycetota bacterium]